MVMNRFGCPTTNAEVVAEILNFGKHTGTTGHMTGQNVTGQGIGQHKGQDMGQRTAQGHGKS